MVLNFEALGERTLNKIAEAALASRVEKAESLTVRVKTDPNLLSRGMLESLSIDGRGLVMGPGLHLREMRVALDTIAVSPLKALVGNIQLTRPGEGTISVLLGERDIETAYRALSPGGPRVEAASCEVSAKPEAIVRLQVRSTPSGRTESLTLTVTPIEGGVTVDVAGAGPIPPDLARAVSNRTREIFHLKNLELDGLSLAIERVEMGKGEVRLLGRADLTRFPSR